MLVAWYPLKEDINDYSLNNYHLTNTNPLSVVQDPTDGKLGKCYNFSGAGSLKNLSTYWQTFDMSKFTLSAWLKPTSYTGSGDWFNGGIGIMSDGLVSFSLSLSPSLVPVIQICNADNYFTWEYYYCDNALLLNAWSHLTITVKGKTIIFYINGVKINSLTITGNVMPADASTFFAIGCDYPGGDEYYIGKCNDVRMYNEVLTLKQIREIYKTCMLRYNFNDPYAQPINNIYTGTQYNASNIVLTYNFETDIFENYGFNKAMRMTPGTYSADYYAYSYMLDPALFIAGKTYTFICYAYNSEDCNANIRLYLEGNFTVIANCLGNGNIDPGIVNSVKGKVQLLWITFTAVTVANIADNAKIMFYPNPNTVGVFTTGYQLITGMQIYEGDNVLLPSPFIRDGIISDNSEFGNNASALSTNYPKWVQGKLGEGCYKFNNKAKPYQYINSINSLIIPKQWTMACWIKGSASEQIPSDNIYPFGWRNLCIIGPSACTDCRSGIIYFINDTEAAEWNPGGRGIYDGNWHHVAIAYDSDTGIIKQYVDGVLRDTGNVTNIYHIGTERSFRMGSAWGDDYYGGFTGSIDDVRVYATVLNDTDIESLYQSRCSLDNNGNFYCNEVMEFDDMIDGKFQMAEDGILKCERIDELNIYGMDYKQLDDGSEWAKIFYHRNHSGTVLFGNSAEALRCNTDDKYSNLYLLEKFKNIDSKFEFMLEYPDDLTGYNRWRQTTNPVNDTGVAGYEAVSIDWDYNNWQGLCTSSSSNLTFIDGSPTTGEWFYAIGSYSSFDTGIPGPNSAVSYVELWVRIDNVDINKNKIRFTRDNIFMASIIEG